MSKPKIPDEVKVSKPSHKGPSTFGGGIPPRPPPKPPEPDIPT